MPPGEGEPEITSRSVPAPPAGLDAHGAGGFPERHMDRPDLLATSTRGVAGRRWPAWLLLVVLFPLSVYGWAPDGLFESWYAPVHVVWAIACGAGLCCPGPARRGTRPPGPARRGTGLPGRCSGPRGAGRCFRVRWRCSGSREARDGEARGLVSLRGLVARLPTLLLVAGVYGAAALVSWRALGWSAHPDRMPGPRFWVPRGAERLSGNPHLEALNVLAFLAAAAVLVALWLRCVGGLRSCFGGIRSLRLVLDRPEAPGGRVLSNEGGSPC